MRVLSLRLVVLLIDVLPRRARQAALRRLAALRYRRYYAGTRPKVANMRERLGVSPEAAERLLLRSFELELPAILDGLRLRSLTAANSMSLIELRGIERLDQALERGRGAVLTTGHVHGLPAFFGALGVHGYRPNVVRLRAREHKRLIARWIYDRSNVRLERCGCTMLWMEPGSFGVGARALNALRRNEIVVSPIDLSQSNDNAVVEFFGSPATFPRGLAILANVCRAPLIDFYVYRDEGGRLIAEIGEAYAVTDVDAGAQHSATRLESQVRKHPADWLPWHAFDEWRPLSGDGPGSHRCPEAAARSINRR